MLHRFSLAVLVLFLYHSPAEGQTRLRFGPELGASVSQLPGKYVVSRGGPPFAYRELEQKALVAGPLVGGRAQLEVGSRWLFAGAARYQMLGNDHSYILEYTTGSNQASASRYRHRQHFHQVGVPLSVGYRLFRISNVPVTFSAGAQLNWIVRAQYQTENTARRQGEIVFYDKEEPVDLLERTTPYRVPVRPFQVQLHTSLSAPLGDKFRLFMQYNAGRMLSAYDDYSSLHFDPWICIEPFWTSFRHSEFSVVAAYLF